MRLALNAMVLLSLVSIGGLTHAQNWPVKPLKIMVPYAPGGPTDLLARVSAQKLRESLGQPVIVDFKAGGNGIAGTEQVAKSAPDGYTLVLVSPAHTTNPSTYRSLPYDSIKDFAFVSPIADSDYVLMVGPNSPASTLRELIAAAKSMPGKLNFGSGGTGGPVHLGSELLNLMSGISMVHIPYKGSGPAVVGLMAGEVDMLFVAAPLAAQLSSAGKVRLIGVASVSRTAMLPNAPTLQEQGLANFEIISRYGLAAPGATPESVVKQLNLAMREILDSPSTRELFTKQGVRATWLEPRQYTEWIRAETLKWAAAVKAAKFELQ